MSKTLLVKIFGMVGALLTGAYMIYTGDVLNGVGVIAASVTSANLTGAT